MLDARIFKSPSNMLGNALSELPREGHNMKGCPAILQHAEKEKLEGCRRPHSQFGMRCNWKHCRLVLENWCVTGAFTNRAFGKARYCLQAEADCVLGLFDHALESNLCSRFPILQACGYDCTRVILTGRIKAVNAETSAAKSEICLNISVITLETCVAKLHAFSWEAWEAILGRYSVNCKNLICELVFIEAARVLERPIDQTCFGFV